MPDRLPRKLWKQLNENPRIQAGLEARAKKGAARAQQITNAEGGKARISVQRGVRPGGRAYAYVVTDSPAEEFGTESTKAIRAVGRAMREV